MNKEMTKLILKNKNCVIEYDPNFQHNNDAFYGEDLNDNLNCPAFYSVTARSHKKAWRKLIDVFDDNMTMSMVMDVLRSNGIKTHRWMLID